MSAPTIPGFWPSLPRDTPGAGAHDVTSSRRATRHRAPAWDMCTSRHGGSMGITERTPLTSPARAGPSVPTTGRADSQLRRPASPRWSFGRGAPTGRLTLTGRPAWSPTAPDTFSRTTGGLGSPSANFGALMAPRQSMSAGSQLPLIPKVYAGTLVTLRVATSPERDMHGPRRGARDPSGVVSSPVGWPGLQSPTSPRASPTGRGVSPDCSGNRRPASARPSRHSGHAGRPGYLRAAAASIGLDGPMPTEDVDAPMAPAHAHALVCALLESDHHDLPTVLFGVADEDHDGVLSRSEIQIAIDMVCDELGGLPRPNASRVETVVASCAGRGRGQRPTRPTAGGRPASSGAAWLILEEFALFLTVLLRAARAHLDTVLQTTALERRIGI